MEVLKREVFQVETGVGGNDDVPRGGERTLTRAVVEHSELMQLLGWIQGGLVSKDVLSPL